MSGRGPKSKGKKTAGSYGRKMMSASMKQPSNYTDLTIAELTRDALPRVNGEIPAHRAVSLAHQILDKVATVGKSSKRVQQLVAIIAEPPRVRHAVSITPAIQHEISGGAARIVAPVAAQIAIEDVYNEFSACRGSINGGPAAIADCPAGTNISTAWRKALYLFGNASDMAIARGGDLVHDIGNAASQDMPNAPAGGTSSMINFLTSMSPAPLQDTHQRKLAGYIRSIPAILRDFNQFRIDNLSAENIPRTRVALNTLTDALATEGVTHVCLDAQFGNLFKDGFGSGMTFISSTASEIDGASKVGAASIRAAGLTFATDHTSFIFPDFYPGVIHELQKTVGRNTVTIQVGGQQIAVSCNSGFSVNALCNLLRLTPPRGSGTEGTPIQFVRGDTVNKHNHHIMMVKPMTDWAQVIYVFLLNLRGVRTVLITNDQYCLALAAALGLPYVLRTPYAGCDIIEFYRCDPNFAALTLAEDAQIRATLTAPRTAALQTIITTWNQRAATAIACMTADNVPVAIVRAFQTEMQAVAAELNAILAIIGVAPAAGVDMTPYRALLNISVEDFVKSKMEQKTSSVAIRFASLGVRLQYQLHTHIAMNTDAIGNVYNILQEFFPEQDDFMDVFNHLGGRDGVISVRDAGVGPGWQNYYRYYLTQVNAGYGAAYAHAAPAWSTQQESMKRAMSVIAPSTILFQIGRQCAPIAPLAVIPTFQAGGADESDDRADAITAEYEYYASLPADSYYKPSVSDGIEEKILSGFTDTDPVTRAAEIASVLEALSIDGDETVGDIYRINISTVRDLAEALARGELSSADFATDVLALIFFHDSAMFVVDVLSPTSLAKFLDAIVYLLEPSSNLVLRNLESKSKAASSNSQLQLALAESMRARRKVLGLYDTNTPSPDTPALKTGVFTIADFPSVQKNTQGTQKELVMVRSRGGARHRRSRRRGSRAAARRARTFRRRK